MISNKVYPNRPNDSNICIICMDENKNTITHHCSVCVKDSWRACDDCLNKLDKCPICRTQFNPMNPEIPINQIIINITINDNVGIRNNDINNRQERLIIHKFLLKCCLITILGTYLGKIITFAFCQGVCNKDKCEEYGCSSYIKSEYWKKVFGFETILGILIIIVGKTWIYKLRNN